MSLPVVPVQPGCPFAAVLLAGGRSQRMGRDKALLPLPDGQPLWWRQLNVLKALTPDELFISGPAREGFPASVRLLCDETPGLGPLAGLVGALRAMRAPLLAVLAIDLPLMKSDYLWSLLAVSRQGCGTVPRKAGFYEPLAAVYPAECFALAEQCLGSPDRSLQTFVRAAEAVGLIQPVEIVGNQAALFQNWNRPEDVAASHDMSG